MNIKNFETAIDKTILQRGVDYYKTGAVESLVFEGDAWVAEVLGSEYYTVTVELNDSGDIVSSDCDCPYDFGIHCKHQAAVFFALRKELENPANKAKSAPAPSLEVVLEKQDKAALVKVLLEYAKQDRHTKQDLLLRFADKSKDMTEYARKTIKTSIERVMRRGFIEYDDVEKAVEGACKVLKMAEGMSGDILPRISLCSVVLEEMMELYNECENSEDIDGVIWDAVKLIKETTETIPAEFSDSDTEKVFDLIFAQASSKDFSYYDWQNDLLYACVPLCRLPNIRKKLEAYLMANQGGERYSRNRAQRFLRDIIERFEGSEAAGMYVEQHLENSDFRKSAIQKALNENQLDRALKLCTEGEMAEISYAGLVSQWREMRYSIYEKQNDTENQKKLAYGFVLDGKFEYFLKLKNLHTPDEWEKILDSILIVLKQGRNQHIYVEVLVHEKKKKPLLEYCETHTSAVDNLYEHLLPEYKAETEVLFLKYIRQEAGNASDRRQYRDVCSIIEHYKNACGGKKAAEIKSELLEKYAKRPAFKDELNKLS